MLRRVRKVEECDLALGSIMGHHCIVYEVIVGSG
jgi:hypothetical protein